jgi:hypothetical protein
VSDPATVGIGLSAAVVAVDGDTPQILVTRVGDGAPALPAGPFDPRRHRTLEIALRTSIAAQTALDVGYVEQLYTFGDLGRSATPDDVGPHIVSIGYLALTRRPRDAAALAGAGAAFRPWYAFFPWEDWRRRRPEVLDAAILPALGRWTAEAPEAATGRDLPRLARARLCFGCDGAPWDEEKVLDRYELLYEAGLVEEAARDGRTAARESLPRLGETMRDDHRRILATAMGRLRAKLKYRPVVFELMKPSFTLTALQQTVEAVAGRKLHKQNFRRLVEAAALVEPTGESETATGGRPAQLYRFRREVIEERPAPGLRFGRG